MASLPPGAVSCISFAPVCRYRRVSAVVPSCGSAGTDVCTVSTSIRYRQYQHSVALVPILGSTRTDTWYNQYRYLVSCVPTGGIVRADDWYFKCHASVFRILYAGTTGLFRKKVGHVIMVRTEPGGIKAGKGSPQSVFAGEGRTKTEEGGKKTASGRGRKFSSCGYRKPVATDGG